ncbi:MAG: radical SAM/SPASM domain-containing protein, partial [Methylococcales bacterium]
VFTYCNRACWFCPNSHIDRRSTNRYMDEGLYLRILRELAEIEYSQTITYSRYNEPLSDRIILTRLKQARAALPNVYLSTYTNGDYVTREYLDELRDAGLNNIYVMTYLGDRQKFSDTKMLTQMMRKIAQLGLSCKFIEAHEGIAYTAELRYKGMTVSILSRNFARTGTDRGGQVDIDPYVRTTWCPLVFKCVYFDWNGCVVPCCNIRSDVPEHQGFIVDDISTGRSIFEAYASSALVDWRRKLFRYGLKDSPCGTCSVCVPEDTAEVKAVVEHISEENNI